MGQPPVRRSADRVSWAAAVLASLLAVAAVADDSSAARQTALEDLGRALFFDVNLSRERNQSCATCHDPARAFTDWRSSGVGAAASLGSDLASLGDRNAPTLSYAAAIPRFGRTADHDFAGGLFWDGRAATLEQQAGGPPLNPLEMAMPDKGAVVQRLQENPNYQYAFKGMFGADIFSDADRAFWTDAMEGRRVSDEDLAHAQRLLQQTGALADTFEKARLYGRRAIDALGPFPQSKAKAALIEAVEFAIARAY